jgi:hypothetical protein
MPVAVHVIFIIVKLECRAILVAFFGFVDDCWWGVIENQERFGNAVERFGSIWIDTITAF